MALFEWQDKYSIKVKSMDQQHLKIVEMINELYRALLSSKPRDILGETLDRMIDYAVEHFHDEEEMMRRHEYSWLDSHRASHEAFVDKVLAYRKQFEAGTLALSTEITNFLKDWLVSHIMNDDRKYGLFMNQKGLY